MIYVIHVVAAVIIILGQSVVLPMFFHSNGLYDLLLPVVAYLSIFRSRGESVVLLLLFGVTMDAVSGGATGVYLLTYLWLWIGLRLAIIYLDKDNLILQVCAVFSGILLETCFFWMAGVLPGGVYPAVSLIRQLALVTVTAPFFMTWWRRFIDHLPRSLPRREKNTVTGFFLDRLS